MSADFSFGTKEYGCPHFVQKPSVRPGRSPRARPTPAPVRWRPSGAQVGPNHVGVGLDLVGRALGDLHPVVQGHHAVGQPGSHPEVVLHQEPGPSVPAHALDLRPAEVGIVGALLAVLLVLSFWPAGITDRTFGGEPAGEVTTLVEGGR